MTINSLQSYQNFKPYNLKSNINNKPQNNPQNKLADFEEERYCKPYIKMNKTAFKGRDNSILIEKYTDTLKTRSEQLEILNNDIKNAELSGAKEQTGVAQPLTLKKADGSDVIVNLSKYQYNDRNTPKELYLFKTTEEGKNEKIVGFCLMDNKLSKNEFGQDCLYVDDLLNLTEGNERIKGIGSIGLQLMAESAYNKGTKGLIEFNAQRIVKDQEGKSEAPFLLYLDKGFTAFDRDITCELANIKDACDEKQVPYVYMDEVLKQDNRLFVPKDVAMHLSSEGKTQWLAKIHEKPVLNETQDNVNSGKF
ncbi:MAG TPA: hypothetical protein P5556_00040 [Candidatus Gastranaerophilales bacterium]|nr:hypothetical protein [Candidatus Gastranaerophilales bacterium]